MVAAVESAVVGRDGPGAGPVLCDRHRLRVGNVIDAEAVGDAPPRQLQENWVKGPVAAACTPASY